MTGVEEAIELVQEFVPEYKVTQKSASKLHRAIGWCLARVGNTGYMSSFWTTLGRWTAQPTCTDASPNSGDFAVILHEGVHAIQSRKYSTGLLSFWYLFPQGLAILSLLSPALVPLVGLGALWGLLGLVLFAPLPAVGRAIIEFEAYKVSLAATYWAHGIPVADQDEYLDWLTSEFTTGAYYWMWPFKAAMKARFLKFLEDLRDDKVSMTPYLTRCRQLAEDVKTKAL
jgi:hypothetical protein